MSTTILALEAHDDEILEVGDGGLTHFHLAWNLTWVTGDFKDDRLLFHEVVLLEGFGEVDFGTDFLGFNLLDLLFGVLLIVAHGD